MKLLIKNNQLKINEIGKINNFRISDLFIINYDDGKIKKLFLSRNEIKILDELPDELVELNCSSNKINEINNLPNTLKKISCQYNNISQLNYLPESLEYLDCRNNKINNIDNLPSGLLYLNCSYNMISNIDSLPHKLEILICSNNKINNVNNLPNSLIKLNISFNNIQNIIYPEKLICLIINKSNINGLFESNLPNLENLHVYKNKIDNKYDNNDLMLEKYKLLTNKTNLLIHYH